jgi:hypothetical protein
VNGQCFKSRIAACTSRVSPMPGAPRRFSPCHVVFLISHIRTFRRQTRRSGVRLLQGGRESLGRRSVTAAARALVDPRFTMPTRGFTVLASGDPSGSRNYPCSRQGTVGPRTSIRPGSYQGEHLWSWSYRQPILWFEQSNMEPPKRGISCSGASQQLTKTVLYFTWGLAVTVHVHDVRLSLSTCFGKEQRCR